jgi:geranylgeranyl reductase family protein
MEQMVETDVIVVGAGPEGALAGYILATQGINVTLFEKTPFPRYKVCGGGLTHKILQEIRFDISPVIETTIHSFRFSHQYANVFTRHSDEPLMYCTMRADLDAFLLQKAIAAGAAVRMGEKVTSFKQDKSGVTVATKEKSFRARVLIGAEGASGIVARTAGLRNAVEMEVAWEAEVTADPKDVERFSDTVFLDWGTLPGGYAWVFPKKDQFSIGVGGPAALSKSMMQYYDRFVESISLNTADSSNTGIRFLETNSFASWPIPVRTKNSPFHNGLVLVTGDSAGLGDSLTGEGIYYAIRSGRLAAETCFEYLSGEISSLDIYSKKINDELMTELLTANKIKHLLNAFPLRVHCFVGNSDRAWSAFGKILRGERCYADVRRGFGKWKFLWNLICFVCGIVGNIRKKMFLKRSTALND